MCKLIRFPVVVLSLQLGLFWTPTQGAQRSGWWDSVPRALAPVQGVWSQMHYEAGGQVVAERDPRVQMIIRGDRWETRQDGTTTESGDLRVASGSSDSVMAVDMVINSGPRRGQVVKALMSVREDRLHVAGANPGYNRPREFATQSGDENAYTAWRRER